MQHEPALLEVLLTRLGFFFYGRSVYKEFADLLPIGGSEEVLDFGCGMGRVAYYAVKKLPRGYLTCLDISGRWLNACRETLRKYGNVAFLQAEAPALPRESFDVAYCHFVLHDIAQEELERVIPALAKSLKPGGAFVFREPLNEMKKLNLIKGLIEKNRLSLQDSRITDIPLMGNVLESIYIKE
ncbi:methylase involved in ubiquinone/menaquinone biosynthesis [Desulfosporosinus youngiae DSM 17734]|uniref:Methylase involved in ubiquinone/menaquinone biosynthesis n=2 Tax=Desulfosporosinus TaxID=79206 RepID=H5XWU4_9FIRM|nr:methylase involved in ubiquinone/menaquinone biosynthesis [Desulfosporosinus youngiae DSM 17734]